MNLEELLGVVVAASGQEENLFQAPAAVTVLDRDDIRSRAAWSVPDLLRTVPGVQVIQIAPGNYVVSLRGTGGLQGNNVIVLLDGMLLNNPVDASVDWAALPVDVRDIARIEVARGPVSPIFGANAFTGVIDIQTVEAADAGSLAGDVSAGGAVDLEGAFGSTVRGAARGQHGPVRWALRGHAQQDDTYSSGESSTQPGLRRFGLGGNLDAQLSEQASLRLDLAHASADASAMDGLVLEPGAQRSHATLGRLALSLSPQLEPIQKIELWTRGSMYRRDADGKDFEAFYYDETRGTQGQSGLDATFALPSELTVSLGGEVGFVDVDAPFIHPAENDTLRLSYGGRINVSIDLWQRLIVATAGRVDISSFTDSAQLSLRASAIYYRPTWSARLTAGSAYRNPSFVEAGSRFEDPRTGLILLEGESDLQVPRFEALEAAGVLAIGSSVTLQPTVYLARARHLIEGDFEPLVRKTFRNGQTDAALLGCELELEARVTQALDWELRATALTFLRDTQDPNTTVGTADHNSRWTAYSGARTHLLGERLLLSAGATFVSSRSYSVRAGIPPTLLRPVETGNFVRLDAVADYRWSEALPLHVRLAVTSHVPDAIVESPLPGAAELGTRALAEVRYDFE